MADVVLQYLKQIEDLKYVGYMINTVWYANNRLASISYMYSLHISLHNTYIVQCIT